MFISGKVFGRGSAAPRLRGVFLVFAGQPRRSVAQRISIRNAIGHVFSPVFMRLVADARIEALFLDARSIAINYSHAAIKLRAIDFCFSSC